MKHLAISSGGMEAKLTEDEFVAGYAERSRMTVEQLRQLGLRAEPCDCGENGCQGWKMVHVLELEWRTTRA